MSSIETRLHLPPGPVPAEVQHDLLDLLFNDDPIFTPHKYGRIDGDELVDSSDPIGVLESFWRTAERLTVTGKPASQFMSIMPNRGGDVNWTGSISWCTPKAKANRRWLSIHAERVAAMMHLLGSPLAYAGTSEDVDAKCWHWVDDPLGGQRREPTVRTPADGIPGMFWRLFVGKPFIDEWPLLCSIDAERAVKLDEDLWMLTPYADPADANTDSGIEAEQQLIDLLGGSEYFYNHATSTPPSKRPTLV